MPDLNDWSLADFLKGPCDVLYADPSEEENPANLLDIFDPDGEPYALKGKWKTFGATLSGSTYSRQFSTQGLQIEQATGNVDEEVTDVVRVLQCQFGQITPELLQMLEGAVAIDTVAKAKGRSAEKQIKVGSVESLSEYLVAFVAKRQKGKGADVKESGGAERGRFVAFCAYRAKLTADQAAIQLAKGQAASAPLSFQCYPDSTQDFGEEHGIWLLEESGSIEAGE